MGFPSPSLPLPLPQVESGRQTLLSCWHVPGRASSCLTPFFDAVAARKPRFSYYFLFLIVVAALSLQRARINFSYYLKMVAKNGEDDKTIVLVVPDIT